MKKMLLAFAVIAGLNVNPAQATEVVVARVAQGPFLATVYVPVKASQYDAKAGLVKTYMGMSQNYIGHAEIAAKEACVAGGNTEAVCSQGLVKIESLSDLTEIR